MADNTGMETFGAGHGISSSGVDTVDGLHAGVLADGIRNADRLDRILVYVGQLCSHTTRVPAYHADCACSCNPRLLCGQIFCPPGFHARRADCGFTTP